MPKEAIRLGGVDYVKDLNEIAPFMLHLAVQESAPGGMASA